MTAYHIILALIILSAAAAVMVKDLLISAICLAASSVALTLALFKLNAPWAAVFELSVCAGLITVLFVSAVSIVRKEEQFLREDRLRFYALPFFVGLAGLALWLFADPMLKAFMPKANAEICISVGDMLWTQRWTDLAGQLCILIAGALMIKTFFSPKEK
ncbi:MAG: hypothetical protein NTW04_00070 [Elusimicrobia bacterium]|nr:hypothetical protein [Elusimicrobiota bacterium]